MCVHIGTRYVILTKNWMWLPDDGFMWTETFWSSFYNFNYFNNLRILKFVCISWKIKCLILLMHGATMKFSDSFRFCVTYSYIPNLICLFPSQLCGRDTRYSPLTGKAAIKIVYSLVHFQKRTFFLHEAVFVSATEGRNLGFRKTHFYWIFFHTPNGQSSLKFIFFLLA